MSSSSVSHCHLLAPSSLSQFFELGNMRYEKNVELRYSFSVFIARFSLSIYPLNDIIPRLFDWSYYFLYLNSLLTWLHLGSHLSMPSPVSPIISPLNSSHISNYYPFKIFTWISNRYIKYYISAHEFLISTSPASYLICSSGNMPVRANGSSIFSIV